MVPMGSSQAFKVVAGRGVGVRRSPQFEDRLPEAAGPGYGAVVEGQLCLAAGGDASGAYLYDPRFGYFPLTDGVQAILAHVGGEATRQAMGQSPTSAQIHKSAPHVAPKPMVSVSGWFQRAFPSTNWLSGPPDPNAGATSFMATAPTRINAAGINNGLGAMIGPSRANANMGRMSDHIDPFMGPMGAQRIVDSHHGVPPPPAGYAVLRDEQASGPPGYEMHAMQAGRPEASGLPSLALRSVYLSIYLYK